MRTLLRYVRPWRGLATVLIAAVVVRVIADLVQRMALKDLIETGLKPMNADATITVVIVIAAAVVVSTAAHLSRDVLQARLAANFTNDVRERYFKHLQGLSSGYFAHVKVNDLMGRFNGDIGAIETAFAAVMSAVSAIIAILFAAVALSFLDQRLTLVCAIAVPFMILGPRLLTPRAVAKGHEVKRELRNTSNTVNQTLNAQNVVRAYQLDSMATEEFQKHQAALHPLLVRFNMLNAFAERTPAIALQGMSIAVLAVGSWYVFDKSLKVGELVAYYSVVQSLAIAVREMAGTVPVLIRTAVSVRRIEEILALPVDVAEAPNAAPLPPLKRDIVLRGVEFGYEKDRVVLQVPDLTIQADTSVAFVGGSGSGKSTALSLIMRFYDPKSGTVLFDGQDLRHVTKKTLYGQMAVVFQEGFLFETTIRDNIRRGRPWATDTEIEDAARAAGVHDAIVALPQGYATPIFQFGKSLSGGERQRIALARALLRNPRILLLDEATSALDPTTEAAVQETLDRVRAGRTMISVTHRLSTAMGADQIVVFQDGRVAEQGRHADLVARGGAYAALWDKQSGVSLSETGNDGHVRPDWLRRISIFSGLDAAVLTQTAGLFIIERVAAGRRVITYGDKGERFFIVAHGTVSVSIPDAEGSDREIARLNDGDFFGEVALLRQVPRTASVTTVTDCVFATLRGKVFRDVFTNAPDIRAQLEAQMDARLATDHSQRA